MDTQGDGAQRRILQHFSVLRAGDQSLSKAVLILLVVHNASDNSTWNRYYGQHFWKCG